jgi:hypothetical protein
MQNESLAAGLGAANDALDLARGLRRAMRDLTCAGQCLVNGEIEE